MLKELENFGGYTGHVKVRVKHGRKLAKTIETHNAGLAELFKYIADCLSGATSSNIEPGRKPGRLRITSSGAVGGVINVTYSDIKKTTTENVAENPHAYYGLQFTIPMTMLNEGMKFKQLELWSLNNSSQYAVMDLPSELEIETANTSLVVE